MSDHDRGAYTPHNDAPLSFDARQSRGRRGFPTTLVISLVILVGLVGAIVLFYRSGVRGAGEAPTPVGAPVGQIKAPPPAGQAQPEGDAAAGLQIYKSESPAAPSGAPVFAAGPEQPAPRPAPTKPVAAEPVAPVTTHAVPAATPAPAAAASQVAASGATTKAAPAPAPAPAKPVAVAKAKPGGDDVDALLKANPPKAAKPVQVAEAKPAPAPSKPIAQGAAVVQIGAYSSAALAGKGWSDIAAAYPADMAGKGKLVESVDRDGKTLFRGAVSGFASHADAVAFCAKLKADGKACIVR
jgi:cytoskeletal protein RodZ